MSVNELGDQYILMGPYVEFKAKQEVEEEDFPYHHPLGQAVEKARQKGYKVRASENVIMQLRLWTLFPIFSYSRSVPNIVMSSLQMLMFPSLTKKNLFFKLHLFCASFCMLLCRGDHTKCSCKTISCPGINLALQRLLYIRSRYGTSKVLSVSYCTNTTLVTSYSELNPCLAPREARLSACYAWNFAALVLNFRRVVL